MIKALIAKISAKLQAMVANDLAVVVAELKRLSCLWQLAFEIVSGDEPTGHSDVWHTLNF